MVSVRRPPEVVRRDFLERAWQERCNAAYLRLESEFQSSHFDRMVRSIPFMVERHSHLLRAAAYLISRPKMRINRAEVEPVRILAMHARDFEAGMMGWIGMRLLEMADNRVRVILLGVYREKEGMRDFWAALWDHLDDPKDLTDEDNWYALFGHLLMLKPSPFEAWNPEVGDA